MFDFSEELFEPFKKLIEEREKTPKLLRIIVSKYLQDQSICKKFFEGKNFYLIMGYEFFKDFKNQSGLTRNKINNVTFFAGTPVYFDDGKMRDEIFSEDEDLKCQE